MSSSLIKDKDGCHHYLKKILFIKTTIKNIMTLLQMNIINNKFAFLNLLPEIFLTITILAQLIYNMRYRKEDTSIHFELNNSVFLQSFFILFCTLILVHYCQLNATFHHFGFINTKSSAILKELLLVFSILALIPITNGFLLQKLNFYEFYTLYLFSILSALLMFSVGDFLSLYLLIEMQSLCFYVLATFRKQSIYSAEAGLKYFIFGSVISCIFLFALSLLYFCVGTLNFHDLSLSFISFPFPDYFSEINIITLFSVLLITITLLFKIGVVPFHFWVPDVYEGAPISSTLIFSFLPKLVFFDLLLKINHIFGDAFKEIKILLFLLGCLSVILGSYFAIRQARVKRFLIYSSISQVGFPITVIGSINTNVESSVYAFIILYIMGSIVVWTGYLLIYQFIGKGEILNDKALNSPIYITDLSNLFGFDKLWAFILGTILFIISGVPPFSSFIAKFLIIFQLLLNDNYFLAFFLLFSSSISIFYYIRVVKIIFFDVNLETKNNFKYSTVGLEQFFNLNCFLFVFLSLSLLFSFFYLDLLLLLSQFIYYNSFF
jgi:NADH-quinone oxidoreductase subunit N